MEITHQELWELDRKLHCLQRTKHQKIVGQMGLHYGQPLLLMVLFDHQPISQKELAQKLNVTPASVNVSLKRMEKSGWISKVALTEDLRCTSIRLTEKGEGLARRCKEEMDTINGAKYIGFSSEELAQLADFYRRMNQNLQSPEPKGELL